MRFFNLTGALPQYWPAYRPDGYEMIRTGQWDSFLSTYGIQSVVTFVLVFVGLYLFRVWAEEYFRNKKMDENDDKNND